MTTLLAFLLAIAVLVVIHELGHYYVARWCGGEGVAIFGWFWQGSI